MPVRLPEAGGGWVEELLVVLNLRLFPALSHLLKTLSPVLRVLGGHRNREFK